MGFDAVGICRPNAIGEAGLRIEDFIALERHGTMTWLAEKADRRKDPVTLWPEAQSVIMLGVNYAPAENPLLQIENRFQGAISVYAQGADYHDVIKKRLKQFGRWLGDTYGCDLKVFVDTAPVPEKPLAQAAGLGWQGRHTNLVSQDYGSWLFLGAIYTTLDLPPDLASADHCGTCRACLDICPTAAFPAPYQLDARRCISYLTIEYDGIIPRGLRRAIGNRIYGCDDCLAICPWNKFAQTAGDHAFAPRADLKLPLLAELAGLDDVAFRQKFAKTAVKRIGRDRMLRNVAIALGNSRTEEAAPSLLRLAEDPAPTIRAAAVWGLRAILSPEDFDAARAHLRPEERDPDVQAEWD